MIYISDDQKKVLNLIDEAINRGESFEAIGRALYDAGYSLVCAQNGRYISKTSNIIYKGKQSTFVYLIKRKNGLATWSTIRIF